MRGVYILLSRWITYTQHKNHTTLYNMRFHQDPQLNLGSSPEENKGTGKRRYAPLCQGPASAFCKPCKVSRVRWNRLCRLALFTQHRRFRLLYPGSLPQAEYQQPLRVSILRFAPWADMNIIHRCLKMSRITKNRKARANFVPFLWLSSVTIFIIKSLDDLS